MKHMNKKKDYNKILILDFLAIGDLLFITPFLRTIRKNYVNSEIIISINKSNLDIIKDNPNIDKIIYFDKNGEHSGLGYFKYIKKLRGENADLLITLQDNPRLSLLAALSGAKKRIGFSKNLRKFFYTNSIEGNHEKHRVDYYLDVARMIGIEQVYNQGLEMFLKKENVSWAKDFLDKNKIKDKNKAVGLVVGASWKTKLWPVEKFAKLAEQLVKNNNAVILLGGPNDKKREQNILGKCGKKIISVVGETTLKETAALINELDYIVSGDTGPLHIAVAMSTKSIALFGPTEVWRYRPYGRGHKVISKDLFCLPCHSKKCPYNLECMKNISVKDVFTLIN